MTKKNFKFKKTILLVAAIMCVIGSTVYAAYHFLTASEIAQVAGYTDLSQVLESSGTVFDLPPQQSGAYTIQVLGTVSGKNLTAFVDGAAEEKTFIVGAVSRTDGQKLDGYPEIQMSPLVSGYAPWRVNIFTLHGGKTEFLSSDAMVCYFIYECDTLEIFADRTVYLSFYEGIAPSAEIFRYHDNGSISFHEDYIGVKALFELPLDTAKADPQKAAQLVEEMWR